MELDLLSVFCGTSKRKRKSTEQDFYVVAMLNLIYSLFFFVSILENVVVHADYLNQGFWYTYPLSPISSSQGQKKLNGNYSEVTDWSMVYRLIKKELKLGTIIDRLDPVTWDTVTSPHLEKSILEPSLNLKIFQTHKDEIHPNGKLCVCDNVEYFWLVHIEVFSSTDYTFNRSQAFIGTSKKPSKPSLNKIYKTGYEFIRNNRNNQKSSTWLANVLHFQPNNYYALVTRSYSHFDCYFLQNTNVNGTNNINKQKGSVNEFKQEPGVLKDEEEKTKAEKEEEGSRGEMGGSNQGGNHEMDNDINFRGVVALSHMNERHGAFDTHYEQGIIAPDIIEGRLSSFIISIPVINTEINNVVESLSSLRVSAVEEGGDAFSFIGLGARITDMSIVQEKYAARRLPEMNDYFWKNAHDKYSSTSINDIMLQYHLTMTVKDILEGYQFHPLRNNREIRNIYSLLNNNLRINYDTNRLQFFFSREMTRANILSFFSTTSPSREIVRELAKRIHTNALQMINKSLLKSKKIILDLLDSYAEAVSMNSKALSFLQLKPEDLRAATATTQFQNYFSPDFFFESLGKEELEREREASRQRGEGGEKAVNKLLEHNYQSTIKYYDAYLSLMKNNNKDNEYEIATSYLSEESDQRSSSLRRNVILAYPYVMMLLSNYRITQKGLNVIIEKNVLSNAAAASQDDKKSPFASEEVGLIKSVNLSSNSFVSATNGGTIGTNRNNKKSKHNKTTIDSEKLNSIGPDAKDNIVSEENQDSNIAIIGEGINVDETINGVTTRDAIELSLEKFKDEFACETFYKTKFEEELLCTRSKTIIYYCTKTMEAIDGTPQFYCSLSNSDPKILYKTTQLITQMIQWDAKTDISKSSFDQFSLDNTPSNIGSRNFEVKREEEKINILNISNPSLHLYDEDSELKDEVSESKSVENKRNEGSKNVLNNEQKLRQMVERRLLFGKSLFNIGGDKIDVWIEKLKNWITTKQNDEMLSNPYHPLLNESFDMKLSQRYYCASKRSEVPFKCRRKEYVIYELFTLYHQNDEWPIPLTNGMENLEQLLVEQIPATVQKCQYHSPISILKDLQKEDHEGKFFKIPLGDKDGMESQKMGMESGFKVPSEEKHVKHRVLLDDIRKMGEVQELIGMCRKMEKQLQIVHNQIRGMLDEMRESHMNEENPVYQTLQYFTTDVVKKSLVEDLHAMRSSLREVQEEKTKNRMREVILSGEVEQATANAENGSSSASESNSKAEEGRSAVQEEERKDIEQTRDEIEIGGRPYNELNFEYYMKYLGEIMKGNPYFNDNPNENLYKLISLPDYLDFSLFSPLNYISQRRKTSKTEKFSILQAFLFSPKILSGAFGVLNELFIRRYSVRQGQNISPHSFPYDWVNEPNISVENYSFVRSIEEEFTIGSFYLKEIGQEDDDISRKKKEKDAKTRGMVDDDTGNKSKGTIDDAEEREKSEEEEEEEEEEKQAKTKEEQLFEEFETKDPRQIKDEELTVSIDSKLSAGMLDDVIDGFFTEEYERTRVPWRKMFSIREKSPWIDEHSPIFAEQFELESELEYNTLNDIGGESSLKFTEERFREKSSVPDRSKSQINREEYDRRWKKKTVFNFIKTQQFKPSMTLLAIIPNSGEVSKDTEYVNFHIARGQPVDLTFEVKMENMKSHLSKCNDNYFSALDEVSLTYYSRVNQLRKLFLIERQTALEGEFMQKSIENLLFTELALNSPLTVSLLSEFRDHYEMDELVLLLSIFSTKSLFQSSHFLQPDELELNLKGYAKEIQKSLKNRYNTQKLSSLSDFSVKDIYDTLSLICTATSDDCSIFHLYNIGEADDSYSFDPYSDHNLSGIEDHSANKYPESPLNKESRLNETGQRRKSQISFLQGSSNDVLYKSLMLTLQETHREHIRRHLMWDLARNKRDAFFFTYDREDYMTRATPERLVLLAYTTRLMQEMGIFDPYIAQSIMKKIRDESLSPEEYVTKEQRLIRLDIELRSIHKYPRSLLNGNKNYYQVGNKIVPVQWNDYLTSKSAIGSAGISSNNYSIPGGEKVDEYEDFWESPALVEEKMDSFGSRSNIATSAGYGLWNAYMVTNTVSVYLQCKNNALLESERRWKQIRILLSVFSSNAFSNIQNISYKDIFPPSHSSAKKTNTSFFQKDILHSQGETSDSSLNKEQHNDGDEEESKPKTQFVPKEGLKFGGEAKTLQSVLGSGEIELNVEEVRRNIRTYKKKLREIIERDFKKILSNFSNDMLMNTQLQHNDHHSNEIKKKVISQSMLEFERFLNKSDLTNAMLTNSHWGQFLRQAEKLEIAKTKSPSAIPQITTKGNNKNHVERDWKDLMKDVGMENPQSSSVTDSNSELPPENEYASGLEDILTKEEVPSSKEMLLPKDEDYVRNSFLSFLKAVAQESDSKEEEEIKKKAKEELTKRFKNLFSGEIGKSQQYEDFWTKGGWKVFHQYQKDTQKAFDLLQVDSSTPKQSTSTASSPQQRKEKYSLLAKKQHVRQRELAVDVKVAKTINTVFHHKLNFFRLISDSNRFFDQSRGRNKMQLDKNLDSFYPSVLTMVGRLETHQGSPMLANKLSTASFEHRLDDYLNIVSNICHTDPRLIKLILINDFLMYRFIAYCIDNSLDNDVLLLYLFENVSGMRGSEESDEQTIAKEKDLVKLIIDHDIFIDSRHKKLLRSWSDNEDLASSTPQSTNNFSTAKRDELEEDISSNDFIAPQTNKGKSKLRTRVSQYATSGEGSSSFGSSLRNLNRSIIDENLIHLIKRPRVANEGKSDSIIEEAVSIAMLNRFLLATMTKWMDLVSNKLDESIYLDLGRKRVASKTIYIHNSVRSIQFLMEMFFFFQHTSHYPYFHIHSSRFRDQRVLNIASESYENLQILDFRWEQYNRQRRHERQARYKKKDDASLVKADHDENPEIPKGESIEALQDEIAEGNGRKIESEASGRREDEQLLQERREEKSGNAQRKNILAKKNILQYPLSQVISRKGKKGRNIAEKLYQERPDVLTHVLYPERERIMLLCRQYLKSEPFGEVYLVTLETRIKTLQLERYAEIMREIEVLRKAALVGEFKKPSNFEEEQRSKFYTLKQMLEERQKILQYDYRLYNPMCEPIVDGIMNSLENINRAYQFPNSIDRQEQEILTNIYTLDSNIVEGTRAHAKRERRKIRQYQGSSNRNVDISLFFNDTTKELNDIEEDSLDSDYLIDRYIQNQRNDELRKRNFTDLFYADLLAISNVKQQYELYNHIRSIILHMGRIEGSEFLKFTYLSANGRAHVALVRPPFFDEPCVPGGSIVTSEAVQRKNRITANDFTSTSVNILELELVAKEEYFDSGTMSSAQSVDPNSKGNTILPYCQTVLLVKPQPKDSHTNSNGSMALGTLERGAKRGIGGAAEAAFRKFTRKAPHEVIERSEINWSDEQKYIANQFRNQWVLVPTVEIAVDGYNKFIQRSGNEFTLSIEEAKAAYTLETSSNAVMINIILPLLDALRTGYRNILLGNSVLDMGQSVNDMLTSLSYHDMSMKFFSEDDDYSKRNSVMKLRESSLLAVDGDMHNFGSKKDRVTTLGIINKIAETVKRLQSAALSPESEHLGDAANTLSSQPGSSQEDKVGQNDPAKNEKENGTVEATRTSNEDVLEQEVKSDFESMIIDSRREYRLADFTTTESMERYLQTLIYLEDSTILLKEIERRIYQKLLMSSYMSKYSPDERSLIILGENNMLLCLKLVSYLSDYVHSAACVVSDKKRNGILMDSLLANEENALQKWIEKADVSSLELFHDMKDLIGSNTIAKWIMDDIKKTQELRRILCEKPIVSFFSSDDTTLISDNLDNLFDAFDDETMSFRNPELLNNFPQENHKNVYDYWISRWGKLNEKLKDNTKSINSFLKRSIDGFCLNLKGIPLIVSASTLLGRTLAKQYPSTIYSIPSIGSLSSLLSLQVLMKLDEGQGVFPIRSSIDQSISENIVLLGNRYDYKTFQNTLTTPSIIHINTHIQPWRKLYLDPYFVSMNRFPVDSLDESAPSRYNPSNFNNENRLIEGIDIPFSITDQTIGLLLYTENQLLNDFSSPEKVSLVNCQETNYWTKSQNQRFSRSLPEETDEGEDNSSYSDASPKVKKRSPSRSANSKRGGNLLSRNGNPISEELQRHIDTIFNSKEFNGVNISDEPRRKNAFSFRKRTYDDYCLQWKIETNKSHPNRSSFSNTHSSYYNSPSSSPNNYLAVPLIQTMIQSNLGGRTLDNLHLIVQEPLAHTGKSNLLVLQKENLRMLGVISLSYGENNATITTKNVSRFTIKNSSHARTQQSVIKEIRHEIISKSVKIEYIKSIFHLILRNYFDKVDEMIEVLDYYLSQSLTKCRVLYTNENLNLYSKLNKLYTSMYNISLKLYNDDVSNVTARRFIRAINRIHFPLRFMFSSGGITEDQEAEAFTPFRLSKQRKRSIGASREGGMTTSQDNDVELQEGSKERRNERGDSRMTKKEKRKGQNKGSNGYENDQRDIRIQKKTISVSEICDIKKKIMLDVKKMIFVSKKICYDNYISLRSTLPIGISLNGLSLIRTQQQLDLVSGTYLTPPDILRSYMLEIEPQIAQTYSNVIIDNTCVLSIPAPIGSDYHFCKEKTVDSSGCYWRICRDQTWKITSRSTKTQNLVDAWLSNRWAISIGTGESDSSIHGALTISDTLMKEGFRIAMELYAQLRMTVTITHQSLNLISTVSTLVLGNASQNNAISSLPRGRIQTWKRKNSHHVIGGAIYPSPYEYQNGFIKDIDRLMNVGRPERDNNVASMDSLDSSCEHSYYKSLHYDSVKKSLGNINRRHFESVESHLLENYGHKGVSKEGMINEIKEEYKSVTGNNIILQKVDFAPEITSEDIQHALLKPHANKLIQPKKNGHTENPSESEKDGEGSLGLKRRGKRGMMKMENDPEYLAIQKKYHISSKEWKKIYASLLSPLSINNGYFYRGMVNSSINKKRYHSLSHLPSFHHHSPFNAPSYWKSGESDCFRTRVFGLEYFKPTTGIIMRMSGLFFSEGNSYISPGYAVNGVCKQSILCDAKGVFRKNAVINFDLLNKGFIERKYDIMNSVSMELRQLDENNEADITSQQISDYVPSSAISNAYKRLRMLLGSLKIQGSLNHMHPLVRSGFQKLSENRVSHLEGCNLSCIQNGKVSIGAYNRYSFHFVEQQSVLYPNEWNLLRLGTRLRVVNEARIFDENIKNIGAFFDVRRPFDPRLPSLQQDFFDRPSLWHNVLSTSTFEYINNEKVRAKQVDIINVSGNTISSTVSLARKFPFFHGFGDAFVFDDVSPQEYQQSLLAVGMIDQNNINRYWSILDSRSLKYARRADYWVTKTEEKKENSGAQSEVAETGDQSAKTDEGMIAESIESKVEKKEKTDLATYHFYKKLINQESFLIKNKITNGSQFNAHGPSLNPLIRFLIYTQESLELKNDSYQKILKLWKSIGEEGVKVLTQFKHDSKNEQPSHYYCRVFSSTPSVNSTTSFQTVASEKIGGMDNKISSDDNDGNDGSQEKKLNEYSTALLYYTSYFVSRLLKKKFTEMEKSTEYLESFGNVVTILPRLHEKINAKRRKKTTVIGELMHTAANNIIASYYSVTGSRETLNMIKSKHRQYSTVNDVAHNIVLKRLTQLEIIMKNELKKYQEFKINIKNGLYSPADPVVKALFPDAPQGNIESYPVEDIMAQVDEAIRNSSVKLNKTKDKIEQYKHFLLFSDRLFVTLKYLTKGQAVSNMQIAPSMGEKQRRKDRGQKVGKGERGEDEEKDDEKEEVVQLDGEQNAQNEAINETKFSSFIKWIINAENQESQGEKVNEGFVKSILQLSYNGDINPSDDSYLFDLIFSSKFLSNFIGVFRQMNPLLTGDILLHPSLLPRIFHTASTKETNELVAESILQALPKTMQKVDTNDEIAKLLSKNTYDLAKDEKSFGHEKDFEKILVTIAKGKYTSLLLPFWLPPVRVLASGKSLKSHIELIEKYLYNRYEGRENDPSIEKELQSVRDVTSIYISDSDQDMYGKKFFDRSEVMSVLESDLEVDALSATSEERDEQREEKKNEEEEEEVLMDEDYNTPDGRRRQKERKARKDVEKIEQGQFRSVVFYAKKAWYYLFSGWMTNREAYKGKGTQFVFNSDPEQEEKVTYVAAMVRWFLSLFEKKEVESFYWVDSYAHPLSPLSKAEREKMRSDENKSISELKAYLSQDILYDYANIANTWREIAGLLFKTEYYKEKLPEKAPKQLQRGLNYDDVMTEDLEDEGEEDKRWVSELQEGKEVKDKSTIGKKVLLVNEIESMKERMENGGKVDSTVLDQKRNVQEGEINEIENYLSGDWLASQFYDAVSNVNGYMEGFNGKDTEERSIFETAIKLFPTHQQLNFQKQGEQTITTEKYYQFEPSNKIQSSFIFRAIAWIIRKVQMLVLAFSD